MHELSQSTLIDNQISLFCNHAMAMAKRSDDELKLIVIRLSERNENAGWPDLLGAKPPKKDGDDAGSEAEDDAEALAAAAVEKQKTLISKLRNGLLHIQTCARGRQHRAAPEPHRETAAQAHRPPRPRSKEGHQPIQSAAAAVV